VSDALTLANEAFVARYPGERASRQPCQTSYVGAHEVHAQTARDLGDAALRALHAHAPDAPSFADLLEVDVTVAASVRARTVRKLQSEPVEDLRVDFEDGYGVRPDDEEDAHVDAAVAALAEAHAAGVLPPFFGMRTKPLVDASGVRSVRTTERFIRALVGAFEAVPSGFRLTLAKVTNPEQVTAFAALLERLEHELYLAPNTLRFEIMIEVAQAMFGPRGEAMPPQLVDAGNGRCFAAHLGVYDYTASLGITAAHQTLGHPACDFARQVMLASLAGRGVELSDGATHLLPIGDVDAIRGAWRQHARDVKRSLSEGYYQGWDMHPLHLATRYGAAYAFFLEALPQATKRLSSFLSRASVPGVTAGAGVHDDAATGQALMNFFLRAWACGAITDDEALASGLTLSELEGRSFVKVLRDRKGAVAR
jgi:hypothetical protein